MKPLAYRQEICWKFILEDEENVANLILQKYELFSRQTCNASVKARILKQNFSENKLRLFK